MVGKVSYALNANTGDYAIPAGTYGTFIANSGSGFILGTTGLTSTTTYNFQSLTLNSSAHFQVLSPVIVTVATTVSVNSSVTAGNNSNPAWLSLRVAGSTVTVSSNAILNAAVHAPNGRIQVSGRLRGACQSNDLTIDQGGVLEGLMAGGSNANSAPVANAGTNQTITLPASATLSGSATDDGLPNPPAALTYTWSKTSGPGTVTFGNANAAATSATFGQAGTYVLTLMANDSALTGTSNVTIVVQAQNQSPVANAGVNQTITLPASATLSGSATDDGFPNPPGALTFTWSKTSGPGTVTFGNANAAATSANFGQAAPMS